MTDDTPAHIGTYALPAGLVDCIINQAPPGRVEAGAGDWGTVVWS